MSSDYKDPDPIPAPDDENAVAMPETDAAEEQAAPYIPPRQKRRPRKRKFIAGLLAAVIPGTGHLYLGLLRKGITFIYLILLDIMALLYFSSIGMQINVPLLIVLALLIPAMYFYNVFDVLQSADRILRLPEEQDPELPDTQNSAQKTGRRVKIGEPGVSFGVLLLVGGVLLFLFNQKPAWLQVFIQNSAGAAVAVLLMILGLLVGVREVAKEALARQGKERRSRRAGRYTAAIVLAGVGVLLLLDWRSGTEHMLLLLQWWPVVPVLWGAEYLLLYFLSRRRNRGAGTGRTKPDLRGLISAVILGAIVFIVTEQEHYLHLWNRVSLNLTVAAVDYGESEGGRYEKAPVIVPVELNTSSIDIEAINGDILIHRAAVEDIEIKATVWVDQLDGVQAEAIADQSFVEVTEGTTIKITPQGKAYGDSGKRQPRMNLDISLPEDRRFNLNVRTMNGGLTLQNVEAIADISLETGNGELILHRIFGNVKGKTLNGAVRARNVQGGVELTTNGGDMGAWEVSGALKLSTAVGNISATDSGDAQELSTKNGNVEISGVRAKLKAESLNGRITVRSNDFGGDWDIYSAVGDIDLHLPESGNYAVEGSSGYGDIITDLPELTVDRKTLSGQIGTGEFKLRVDGNSNLNVSKY
ncbi:DUF4097 family beta strand repeat-containing protein [Paenibacillus sp. MMS20-IR301]|uniref:DUF4097 family beta strand repeat-containing protein n=1 Tax=Paenibacillus sp. MMS20-IR301 TaxID=2895946 RepID=UPI0028EDA7E0|nr:DUF4097 family beta strand repeat-containing protein [Paenibacillus sp. MMS20-IR301]WNS43013.1 DUF4097 family beta strand repeat-containing protein [Paenibacillus sp. MMS20-IR301]